MTNKESSKKLIDEAEKICKRDLKGALDEKDYNMVVRRAQEVVELTLKGALKVLGADYPKVHDVGSLFVDQARLKLPDISEDALKRIEAISAWLGEARAPSFYMEKDYSAEDARRAFEDASFILEEVKRALNIKE